MRVHKHAENSSHIHWFVGFFCSRKARGVLKDHLLGMRLNARAWTPKHSGQRSSTAPARTLASLDSFFDWLITSSSDLGRRSTARYVDELSMSRPGSTAPGPQGTEYRVATGRVHRAGQMFGVTSSRESVSLVGLLHRLILCRLPVMRRGRTTSRLWRVLIRSCSSPTRNSFADFQVKVLIPWKILFRFVALVCLPVLRLIAPSRPRPSGQ